MNTNKYSSLVKLKKIAIALYVLVFLVGCVAKPDKPSSPQSSKIPPTASISFTATASPANTKPPTDLSMSPLTTSPSPTYSPEEIRAQIDNLIATNGYCEFPCWWGLMPGETTFDEAEEFIGRFSHLINTWYTDEKIPGFGTEISAPESISLNGKLFYRGVGSIPMGGVLRSQAVFGYSYSMSEVLAMLGEPSEIHFSTPRAFYSNSFNFDLFLYYPAVGILVRYISETTTPDPTNVIRICDLDTKFDPLYFGAGFLFWNPEDKLTFMDAIRLLYYGVYPPDYASVEKISNMDPHTFYINFSQPGNECLIINTQLFGSEADRN